MCESTKPERPPVHTIDQRIGSIAGRQHRVISIEQLLSCGLTSSSVTKRLRTGRLRRIHRGVYVVGPGPLTFEGRAMAAVLAAGPGSFVTGHAAAWLLGIMRCRPRRIDVVTTRQRSIDGVRVRRCRSHEGDVTTRCGIPIATLPRLLVDLAQECTKWELANLIHEAAYRGMVEVGLLERTMARCRTRRGHGTLVAALRAWIAGGAGAMSRLELQVLRMLEEAGVTEPHVNTIIDTMDGAKRVDLYWPELRICAEVDGHVVHGRPPTKLDDERRDQLLRMTGLRHFRVRERHLRRDVDALVAAIRAEQAARAAIAQPAPGAMPV